jgi:hypothetical protein
VKAKPAPRIFLLFFLICFHAVVFVHGQTAVINEIIKGDIFREEAGRGLMVRTEPSQARVFVDGIEQGLSPLTLNVNSGIHVVRLVKEGYRERVFNVTLSSGSRLVMSIELEATVGQAIITARRGEGSPSPDVYPFAPEIFIDGKQELFSVEELAAGTGITLPIGYHTIQVRSFGWTDASTTVYIREGFIIPAELVLTPSPFRILQTGVERPRFNPANSGSLGLTRAGFEVSSPGKALITIKAPGGETVYTAELGPFTSRQQTVVWNGREQGAQGVLPDGVYRITIEGVSIPWDDSEPVRQSLVFEAAIDSSINIYPLSINGAVPGLIFAASPAVLPRGSFQIEGGLFFGRPSEAGVFSSLPFEAGTRLSVIEKLELAAVLNAVPVFGKEALWGLALSAKWQFLRTSSGIPLEMAAGLSYGWSQDPDQTPQKEGLSIRLPLSLDFRFLSLLFAPGIRTAFPGDSPPRLFLPAGVLFRHTYFIAGISFLPEFSFSPRSKNRAAQGPAVFELGAEIKWYPPPSIFVYTLSGGIKTDRTGTRGFGGIGIGIVW